LLEVNNISKTELQLKSKVSLRKLHSSSKQRFHSDIRARPKRSRPNRSIERRRHHLEWLQAKSSSRHISDLKFSDVWNKMSDSELSLWDMLMDESHHVDSTRNEHVVEATP
jgi:hypothetical protein